MQVKKESWFVAIRYEGLIHQSTWVFHRPSSQLVKYRGVATAYVIIPVIVIRYKISLSQFSPPETAKGQSPLNNRLFRDLVPKFGKFPFGMLEESHHNCVLMRAIHSLWCGPGNLAREIWLHLFWADISQTSATGLAKRCSGEVTAMQSVVLHLLPQNDGKWSINAILINGRSLV